MQKRILIYLNEMFPITSFIGTLLTGFSFQLIYLRLFKLPLEFHYQMLFSSIAITLVTLLIRIMDEFKDYEDDKKNFPHRPLPSGRVLPEDLKYLGYSCVGLFLILSTTSSSLFVFSLLTLGFTGLMLKWFFVEKKMRQSLPLAFISHHPIVVFNVVYVLLGLIMTYRALDWSKAWFILPLVLMFTNWEISRKIRTPQDETSYTTYSKIWGPKIAISISLVLQVIVWASVMRIFQALESSIILKVVYSSLMLVMMSPSIRFLFTLKLKAPLKITAESIILLTIGFLMAASFL